MQLGVEMAANIAIKDQEIKLAHIVQAHEAKKAHNAVKLCGGVDKGGGEATIASDIIADAKKVKNDIYVDDGTTGGSVDDVRRMKGLKDSEGKFDGTISRILGEVGYNVKTIVQSGDNEDKAIRLLGESVLGYGWDAKRYLMSTRLKFNTSKKRKGLRTKPDLNTESLELFKVHPLTRRILLSLSNSIHDPLGIAVPITVCLKLLMKETMEQVRTDMTSDNQSKADWDKVVSNQMSSQWYDVIKECLEYGNLFFKRPAKPAKAVGSPRVVTLWVDRSRQYVP